MDEPTQVDRRLEPTVRRLQETLVDDDGNAASLEAVHDAVAASADTIKDAPVQEFMPLLVENKTRKQLREQGFRPDWSAIEEKSRAADRAEPHEPASSNPEEPWVGDDEVARYSDAEE
jgi:hypothetical protein